MTNPEQPITGPIVACDNAIKHYREQYNIAKADIEVLERKLSEKKAELQTYTDMFEQWRDAKATLEATQ